jgi:hypothetical protein
MLVDPVSPGQLPALARWAREGAVWVSRRIRPDHAPIRVLSMRPNQFAMVRHFVYAAVAPSRSCARPFDDQAVRRAIAFAGRAAPATFGEQPDISDGSMSLFYREGADGARERALAVRTSGLVELLWSLELHPREEGQLVLPASAVLKPLLNLAEAVAGEEYAQVSGLHHRRRRFGKVDWSFMMTCAATLPGGRETWSAIEVPGDPPPRARGQHGGAFPTQGIGMRSVRRSAGHDVVGDFLSSLLVANGYHELGDTVQRTMLAAEGGR